MNSCLINSLARDKSTRALYHIRYRYLKIQIETSNGTVTAIGSFKWRVALLALILYTLYSDFLTSYILGQHHLKFVFRSSVET